MSSFPSTRMRRNRQFSWLRDLVAEHHLTPQDLILPLFVIAGHNIREPINSMPGVFRFSIDLLITEVLRAEQLGIRAVILFPVIEPHLKSMDAHEAYNPDNLICHAISELKKHTTIGIIADVALDPYTSHGHDGILVNDYVDNDTTLLALSKQALSLAQAGCDIVAPSDMMDGRIKTIRASLDHHAMQHTGILAYAAKYASSFYGPFRDAVRSKNSLGKADKLTYQMDPRNSQEALREIALDIAEGADIIMVKPALPYLDVIKTASQEFNIPLFAYQVSGEYASLKAAALNGWLDYELTMLESLLAIKRAGSSSILTYAACEIAEILCKKNS